MFEAQEKGIQNFAGIRPIFRWIYVLFEGKNGQNLQKVRGDPNFFMALNLARVGTNFHAKVHGDLSSSFRVHTGQRKGVFNLYISIFDCKKT